MPAPHLDHYRHRQPRGRLPLALLVLALPMLMLLPAAALAQDGAQEAYWARWASGLTPADPGSERFRSQASIRELAAFRSEQPEIAADALAFMAEMHREMVEAGTPGHIEIMFEDGEEALLHVVFEGRAGPLPWGLPSEASVRMVRETDGWKLDTESFVGSMMSSGGGASEGWEESCPADVVLGDPASPFRLVLHGGDATHTVHLGAFRTGPARVRTPQCLRSSQA